MKLHEKLRTEDYVHIIDDFYPDLSWLDHHLNAHLFNPVENVNYTGLITQAPMNTQETMSRIELLLGAKLKFFPQDGFIRAQRKSDEGQEKIFIHCDDHRFTVLIYLSDPPEGEAPEAYGTHFYEHIGLKKKKFIPINPGKDAFQKSTVFDDNRNMRAWNNWLTVPFKKNRCIIYDGNLYHSSGTKFFGATKQDWRMTQNFFPTLAD